MKTSRLFEASEVDIEDLLNDYPLANIISGNSESLEASAIPLILYRESDEEPVLIGHFARANAQVAQLRESPFALVIFQGDQAYISPSWFADRTQAPTWNFATVHYWVQIEFFESDETSLFAVDLLTERMESGRDAAWKSDEMGQRRDKMLGAIIAFRARILRREVKFKLGQNERDIELGQSVRALEKNGHTKMADCMRHANRNRNSDQKF